MNLAIPCVRGAAAVRDLRYAIFYRVVFCTCVFAVARIVARYGIFAAGSFCTVFLQLLLCTVFWQLLLVEGPLSLGFGSFCSSIAGRLPRSSLNIISTIYLF